MRQMRTFVQWHIVCPFDSGSIGIAYPYITFSRFTDFMSVGPPSNHAAQATQ